MFLVFCACWSVRCRMRQMTWCHNLQACDIVRTFWQKNPVAAGLFFQMRTDQVSASFCVCACLCVCVYVCVDISSGSFCLCVVCMCMCVICMATYVHPPPKKDILKRDCWKRNTNDLTRKKFEACCVSLPALPPF